MINILWDPDKSRWLKQNRGISFDEVLLLIADGNIADILTHPNPEKYSGQQVILLKVDQYIYCVPFKETEDGIHLITVFPSRKYTRQYLGEVREDMLPYDQSEEKLIESIEKGEWIPIQDSAILAKRMEIYASEELKKKRRVNIRVSERDLKALRRKAVEEGMPYQTLLSSILHKYVTGKLRDI
jgi:predicted DNA binding CopG/RHH family protein/uncharacterized DUF497 family protein